MVRRLLGIVTVIVLAWPSPAPAASDLVRNGLFSLGIGGQPEGWRHEAFNPDTSATRFSWMAGAAGIGSISISSLKPNDARWVQTVRVTPSKSYWVSGWIRTENVGSGGGLGAHITIMDLPYSSGDIRGTHDWQRVGFWAKAGPAETSLEIACRLGGYSALNTGTAYFTGISFDEVETFPVSGAVVNDTDASYSEIGILVALGLGLLLWLLFGATGRWPETGAVASADRGGRRAAGEETARTRVPEAAREALLAGLGTVGFVCLFSYPILIQPWRIGVVWDWAEVLHRNWVAFYSITHFHQLPLWNPYACGGMPLLAHPSSLFVSPLFVLQLIFGPFAGLNLQTPVHLAIAWTGGYMLAKTQGIGFLGSLACASMFPASSWLHLHVAVGHPNFLPFAYEPWILALVWLGADRRTMLPWVVAGMLLAVGFGEGGIYPCTRAVLLASFLTLYLAMTRKSLWPIKGMALLVVFAMGFAAVKLFPSWCMMRLHPRPIVDLEYNPVMALVTGIFTRSQFYDRSRIGTWGFWEIGAYMSAITIALAALGISSSPRRVLPWVLLAVFLFALAIGGPKPWYPWALLHHLPIVSSERVPSRFLIEFTLAVSVMCGFGVDLLARSKEPFGAILASVLLIAALLDAWLVSKPNLYASVVGAPPAVSQSPQFRQVFGSPWEMLATAMSNEGALHCNEELDFHDVGKMKVVGSNQPGYRGEQYLLGSGSIALERWTPNVLSYAVDTPADNVMVVNENYDTNWRVVEGSGEAFSQGGLIAVRLSPGKQHVKLAYRSYPFLAGMVVTLLTCFISLILWRRSLRRPNLGDERESSSATSVRN